MIDSIFEKFWIIVFFYHFTGKPDEMCQSGISFPTRDDAYLLD